jgi:hypothetical protein
MNCREFKSKHVGFVDDVLCAADMAALNRHLRVCARCSTLDIRIRRSLMVVRNLPQIEASPDFYARLIERLKHAPAPPAAQPLAFTAARYAVVTAALAAAVYFAMAAGVRHSAPREIVPVQTVATRIERVPSPISNPELVPAVPAGVPVWPAMFMVGELPMHLANVELLDSGIGR